MYQFLVSFEQVDDVFGIHSVACDDPGPRLERAPTFDPLTPPGVAEGRPQPLTVSRPLQMVTE